jgi:branched-chain amino acid transport system substrate-binding protein
MRHLALRYLLLCFAVTLALAVVACGGDDKSGGGNDKASGDKPAPGPEEKGPIVIGLTGAHSGFMAAFDVPAESAARIAGDEFNAAGGINGRQVKFVAADSKTDPAQSANAAQKVISDGADFVIVSCDYDVGGPAARIAQDKKILSISLCAGSPKWNAIGPLAYSMALGSETEAAAAAQWAAKAKGCKTGYVLTDTFIDYTKTAGEVMKKTFPGEIVGEDTFKNDDQSFSTQVSRLQAVNPKPDCIFLSSVPSGGVTMLRQLRSAGLNQPVISPEGMGGDFWLEAIPDLSDFYYIGSGSIFGDDPDPKLNEVAKLVEKDIGEGLTSATFVPGYSTIEALKIAIERAKSTDTDAVVKQFQSFKDEKLLVGPTTYTETDRRSPGRPTRVIQIQNGKASFVEMFTPQL